MPADTGCAKLKENKSHYEEEWFVKQLQGFVRRAAALVLAALGLLLASRSFRRLKELHL